MVDHMKRRLVSVRPRVGSDLESVQEATNNDMSDIVHSWATAFKDMTRQSQQPDQKEEK